MLEKSTVKIPYQQFLIFRSNRLRMFLLIEISRVTELKETPTHLFSCEYCEIFKNSFLRTPRVAASAFCEK